MSGVSNSSLSALRNLSDVRVNHAVREKMLKAQDLPTALKCITCRQEVGLSLNSSAGLQLWVRGQEHCFCLNCC